MKSKDSEKEIQQKIQKVYQTNLVKRRRKQNIQRKARKINQMRSTQTQQPKKNVTERRRAVQPDKKS